MQNKYLDMIIIEPLKDLTEKALESYSNKNKIEEANKVAELVVAKLKKKKLLTQQTQQTFVDVLLSAALLHNLFYDKEDWTSLFVARKMLEDLNHEYKVPFAMLDALCSTIEGQLGDDTPVPNCTPKPNTPTEMFSECVWIVKEAPNVFN